MKRQIVPVGQEVRFGDQELIVSKTDTRGRITYANRVFMRVANFSERDLLGQQHNIIRHPDMPRGAFRLLWQTLSENREWFGFVKNITADGRFYWVFANVTHDRVGGRVVGYYSVRRQAPRGAIEAIGPIYQRMRDIEAQAGAAAGPDASLQWLREELARRHAGYEAFVLGLYDGAKAA